MRTGSSLRWTIAAIAILGAIARTAFAADVIMVEDAAGPFSRSDGTGYANDIVRAAFRTVGIDIKLDVVPYARCKMSLLTGRTPACFSMSRSDTLEGVVFSAQPIFEIEAVVFQRRAAPHRYASIGDIPPGASVGVVNDYEYPVAVDGLERAGVILDSASDEIVNLRRLARGRLDAVIVMTSAFEVPYQRAIDAGVERDVALSFSAGKEGAYVGFNPRHPDGERLRAAFDDGYARIVRNGVEAEIKARYLADVHR